MGVINYIKGTIGLAMLAGMMYGSYYAIKEVPSYLNRNPEVRRDIQDAGNRLKKKDESYYRMRYEEYATAFQSLSVLGGSDIEVESYREFKSNIQRYEGTWLDRWVQDWEEQKADEAKEELLEKVHKFSLFWWMRKKGYMTGEIRNTVGEYRHDMDMHKTFGGGFQEPEFPDELYPYVLLYLEERGIEAENND